MKAIRFIVSGNVTLILLAVVSGIYLFLSFGDEDPWSGMMAMLHTSIFLKCMFLLIAGHFFCKAADSLFRFKLRRISSVMLLFSLSLAISGTYFSVLKGDTETHRLGAADATEKGQKVVSVQVDIPDLVTIAGDNDAFKIKGAEAVIYDGNRKLTLNPFPFVITSAGYAYINDAGISPQLYVSIDGQELSFSKLEMLPPDKNLSLPLLDDYTMELGFVHDREFEKGRLSARGYNLGNPGYTVTIRKSSEIIFNKVLNDQKREEQGDIIIETGATGKWVEVVFVRDRTVLMFYAALCLLLTGFALYPVEIYYGLSS